MKRIKLALRLARLIQPGTLVLSRYGVSRVLYVNRDSAHPNTPVTAMVSFLGTAVPVPLGELKKVHPKLDACRIFFGVIFKFNYGVYDIPRSVRR